MATRGNQLDGLKTALAILQRIPPNRGTSVEQLLHELNSAGIPIAKRKLQRQLAMLCEAFDQIERDDSTKPYTFRMKKGSHLLMSGLLNPDEALLFSLVKEQLDPLLPATLKQSMSAFFEQANFAVRHGDNPSIKLAAQWKEKTKLAAQWKEKVRVVPTSQPLLPPSIHDGVLEAVSDALYRNHWLEVDYINANQRQHKSAFMPLGLAQQGSRLYLVGRFKADAEERSLAVHRIQSAQVLPKPFERPADFSLKQFEDDGRFAFTAGQWIRLSFDITCDAGLHLKESKLSANQTVRELGDGWLRITATVIRTRTLDRWLLGFGDEVRSIRRKKISAPGAPHADAD